VLQTILRFNAPDDPRDLGYALCATKNGHFTPCPTAATTSR
jgi:hypothetical protein